MLKDNIYVQFANPTKAKTNSTIKTAISEHISTIILIKAAYGAKSLRNTKSLSHIIRAAIEVKVLVGIGFKLAKSDII